LNYAVHIKDYQLLAHGRWFFPGTSASSTTKTGRHDIAEILLKLALKHQKSINQSNLTVCLLDMICKYIVYHTLAEFVGIMYWLI
jgi:hypothetical protein